MRIVREWIQRVAGSFRRGRRDDDLQQELQLHAELAAEEARRRGAAPDDAARRARLRAGGIPQAMETLRDQRGLPWLDALAADAFFGWRQLNKHRAVSGAAILSLAL